LSHLPQVYRRYRRILHTARLLIAEGAVQRQGTVISLLAWRVLVIY